jgi:hypothetical protein
MTENASTLAGAIYKTFLNSCPQYRHHVGAPCLTIGVTAASLIRTLPNSWANLPISASVGTCRKADVIWPRSGLAAPHSPSAITAASPSL